MVVAYIAGRSIHARHVDALICLYITVLVLPAHYTVTVVVIEEILR